MNIKGKNPEESWWKDNFTKVTTFSKYLALSMLVFLPMVGFCLGWKYGRMSTVSPSDGYPTFEREKKGENYVIRKTPLGSDSLNYKYELVDNSEKGRRRTVYTITNWNGFEYKSSDDGKYIAIINYGESLGDEILTLINSEGRVLKDYGHLDSPQALVPIYWSEHYYWLSMGIPIGEPVGAIRINADTFEVDRYEKLEE